MLYAGMINIAKKLNDQINNQILSTLVSGDKICKLKTIPTLNKLILYSKATKVCKKSNKGHPTIKMSKEAKTAHHPICDAINK